MYKKRYYKKRCILRALFFYIRAIRQDAEMQCQRLRIPLSVGIKKCQVIWAGTDFFKDIMDECNVNTLRICYF